jgi:SnoaL-like domain
MSNTINGMPAKQWWESVLAEGVMGRTGLSAGEAIEKFTREDVWRRDGPQLIGRDELKWHFEWVRRDISGVEFEVEHAICEGDYFAAIHTVKGPNGDKGDYELEVLTFGKVEDGRIAWVKELHWQMKGEETSWTHEFDEMPPVEQPTVPGG